MSKSVLGLSKLQTKLARLADEKTYKKTLGQAGLIVQRNAMKSVPVDTGNLRNSLATQVKGLEAVVGTNQEYALYVEYGTGLFAAKGGGRNTPWSYQRSDGTWVTTSGQRAQPFLGPALRESQEAVVKKFQESINEEIKK